MTMSIRRLGPGDEATLALLAREDADFDLEDEDGPGQPLGAEQARRYLENPAVLHWVAVEGERVVGFLYCLQVPLRSGDGEELLLYEVGVRREARRSGVGRALLDHMAEWMRAQGIAEVWVLADNPGAIAFYRACGFDVPEGQAVYMTRRV